MKRKKRAEEHIDESWLLPYADMLTLLLALFIVMFAMASIDEGKFEEFRSEFGTIFAGLQTGGDSIVGPVINLGGFSNESSSEPQASVSTKEEAEALENQLGQKLEDEQMVQASEELRKELAESEFGKETNVSLKSDGLHINLDSNILFSSGSAELEPDVAESLGVVATHLKKLDQEIIVAGYTDNVPINDRYSSNWELSAARAISVMNYLVDKEIVEGKKISIQAYGENKPHATNQTAQGRAKNRRVEIIIKKVYQ